MHPSAKKKRLVALAMPLIVFIPAVVAGVFYNRTHLAVIKAGSVLPSVDAEPVGSAPPLSGIGRRAIVCFSPDCSFCEETFRQINDMRSAHPEWFSGQSAPAWMLITDADEDRAADFARTSALPVYRDRNRGVFS